MFYPEWGCIVIALDGRRNGIGAAEFFVIAFIKYIFGVQSHAE